MYAPRPGPLKLWLRCSLSALQIRPMHYPKHNPSHSSHLSSISTSLDVQVCCSALHHRRLLPELADGGCITLTGQKVLASLVVGVMYVPHDA